jgi:hypothetical protein
MWRGTECHNQLVVGLLRLRNGIACYGSVPHLARPARNSAAGHELAKFVTGALAFNRAGALKIAGAGARCGSHRDGEGRRQRRGEDPRLGLAHTLPEDPQTTRLPVFFATTRAATNGPEHFGNDAAEGVTLGVAHVRLGEPGSTWDDLVASNRASSVDQLRVGRGGMRQGLRPRRRRCHAERRRSGVRAGDRRVPRAPSHAELVGNVHGYRVTPRRGGGADGVVRYLGQGATVTFQWPTRPRHHRSRADGR